MSIMQHVIQFDHEMAYLIGQVATVTPTHLIALALSDLW